MAEQPEKNRTSLYMEFLEAKTSSKSQGELIVFLYGLAISLMEQAKVTMNKGDMSETSYCLSRVRNIFLHLLSTLNPEAVGDSAKKLSSLYLFIVEKISIADSTKSVQDLDDIIPIVSDIKDAWQESKIGDRQTNPSQNSISRRHPLKSMEVK